MRRLYNIFYSLGLALGAPFLLFGMWRRGQSMEGFRQRFGRYTPNLKQALTNRHVLWLHVSSAEHVGVTARLLEALQERLPNAKIVASARTAVAMAALRQGIPRQISKVYLPLDRKPWVARALSSTNPKSVIVVGTDLWSNFLWRAYERGTPIVLLMTHFSPASLSRLRRYPSLLAPIFRRVDGVAVGNEDDAKLARQLGFRKEILRVAGDLRFDLSARHEEAADDPAAVRARLGISETSRVILGNGVTVEEALALIRVFRELSPSRPQLTLALAFGPDQDSRLATKELRKRGIRYAYRSEVPPGTRTESSGLGCVILDSPAELPRWEQHAAMIFLGDTLHAGSGQDPVTAAAAGRPILFGPRMGEYAEVAEHLVQRQAAIRVHKASDLARQIKRLLDDPAAGTQLIKNARAVAAENSGAIARCVDLIVANVDEELYVSPGKPLGPPR